MSEPSRAVHLFAMTAAIIALAFAAPTWAQEESPISTEKVATESMLPDTDAGDPSPATDQDSQDLHLGKLTGDWNGARTAMEQAGISFDMTLTTYYQHVAHGGLNTHNAHTVIGVNDFELNFDFDAMDFIPGGSFYIWGSNSWGESPSTRGWVGDLFWVNGAEVGDRPIDIHEFAYEQALLDDKLRFRVGKICMSCYFDTNEYAYDTTENFLNYGLNNAPNIPFPGFAFGTLGVQLIYTPSELFYIQAGVTDADAEFNETGFQTAFHGPDNVFSMYEIGWTPTFAARGGKLPGHYRLGFWHDPRPKEVWFNDLGGLRRTVPTKSGDFGVYLNIDQAVFQENPALEDDTQGLGIFLRYSYAGGDVNFIEHFWSTGFQYTGLIPTRDDDVWGFGVAQGLLSGDLESTGLSPHRETAFETYYLVQVTEWMTVTPDLQWILRPGGFDGPDAFVAGLRVRITF